MRRRFRVSKRSSRHRRPAAAERLSHAQAHVRQVIDDEAGKTVVAASTVDKDLRGDVKYGGNKAAAQAVGKAIAERAMAAGVKQVCFDRREYKYHGRVAALAQAAREAGLEFLKSDSQFELTSIEEQPIVAASTERIQGELIEKVIKIKRCAAVVKGGRRFSFAAMVVVGNGHGRVGWGYGKANEVPPAVEKAQKDAQRSMIDVPMDGRHDPAHGQRPLWLGRRDPDSGEPRHRRNRRRRRPRRLRSRRHSRRADQELRLDQSGQSGQGHHRRHPAIAAEARSRTAARSFACHESFANQLKAFTSTSDPNASAAAPAPATARPPAAATRARPACRLDAASVFEGGRMPLVRRIPKRGFHNQWGAKVAIVNVGDIDDAFEAGAEVTPEPLTAQRSVKGPLRPVQGAVATANSPKAARSPPIVSARRPWKRSRKPAAKTAILARAGSRSEE